MFCSLLWPLFKFFLVEFIGRYNIVNFNFFGNMQLIYNFVEVSCNQHAVFENKHMCSQYIILRLQKNKNN